MKAYVYSDLHIALKILVTLCLGHSVDSTDEKVPIAPEC